MGSESIEAARVSKSRSSKFFPPGFRFHPTDEELVLYYLKRKICGRSLKPNIIGEVDVYKWDPEELPGQSKLKTGDRQWFFFCPRDRRYPNGGRSSRATMHGYWKATGKDRIIMCKSHAAGIKKTLVYYLGRAPSGQRTDWVMHEYTMDEDALKKWKRPKEHYALCKVFKKSGPGPKNGEQYGAPFLEEEWSDDDNDRLDVNVEKRLLPVPVEEEPVLTDDIVRFLNQIMDEPKIGPPLAQTACDQGAMLGSSHEQYELHSGSGSGLAQLAYEASEGTSITDVAVEEPRRPSAVHEDFLEMDDLIGPQPAVVERSVAEDLQFADFDGFSEFDLYHDPTGFYEMGTLENQPFQCVNDVEFGTENSGFHAHSSDAVNHQPWHDDHEPSYDLWDFNQRNSTFAPAQPTHVTISHPSSGVVIDESPDGSHANQPPNAKEGDGTNSWFSSALWAFVDSIPTTPASASEGTALVNKAFERMSSFGRGRNVKEAASASTSTALPSGPSRGIIYFSVLGVFVAILWVLLGTSIELLGRCIS